ncbi:MAG: DUF3179 domain-containing protein [Acidobacteria bacterium]|nr:DUF3179 domain-containing protein [Acidobacteriota bacterium]
MIARKLLVLVISAGIAGVMPLDAQRGERGRGGFGAGPPQGPIDISEFKPVKLMEPLKPIINAPMIPAKDVKDQVRPEELVLGVEIGGQARAYPLNMLTGPEREIINDMVGGRAIAATW